MKKYNLRKVSFKKWIPAYYEDTPLGKRIRQGTGCWEKEFTGQGIFHQWASAYEEFETGAGNYTVALVELPDGTINEVLPSNIKFLDPIIQ